MALTARQEQFADAGLRIVAQEGFAGLSFRSVAAGAGMSLGAVQKAFPSKQALLDAMFERMRATAVAPDLGEPGRPDLRGWLVRLTVALLPLDEARRAAQLQASAFGERAATDPAIAGAVAASDHEITGRIAALVRRAVSEGEVGVWVDPDALARTWLALLQGLCSQLLYDPRPEQEVWTDVEFAIARLLGRP